MAHMVFQAECSHYQHSGQVGDHSLIERNCLFVGWVPEDYRHTLDWRGEAKGGHC